jgi:ankyrin repeat protein
VALLLRAGTDPNSADRAGRTPLMFAAAQGWLGLVQVFLAGGADVEAKAANGKMAWQVATGEEVVRVLQEARGKR